MQENHYFIAKEFRSKRGGRKMSQCIISGGGGLNIRGVGTSKYLICGRVLVI